MSFFRNISFKNENFLISLFFLLLSSSWALLIKENLLSENFTSAVFFLYFYIYLIIFIELIILIFFLNSNLTRKLKIFIISLIIFFNFYSISLSLSSEFIVLSKFNKIKFFLIYISCAIIIIQIFLSKIQIIKSLVIFYIIFNLYLLLDVNSFLKFKKKINFEVNLIQQKFIKPVSLYIFSIESLSPEILVKNHYGLEKTKYINSLEKNNFIVFKNHFSDNFPTSPSLNSLIYIDPVEWRKDNNFSYFSGRKNLSLFNLLKLNNYKIITGYYDSHFGPPGKYIDEYLTFRSVKIKNPFFSKIYINFCQFKLPWYHMQLFNYCDVLKIFFKIKNEEILSSKKEFNSYILNKIDNKNKKFVFFHFYTFGHPTGETKNYINDFSQGDLETALIIEQAAKKIRKNDPNSILIVIGDSGPTIFKHSSEKKLKNKILSNYPSKDHALIIDNHATLGSILDHKNICSENINDLQNNIFTTNSMILNNILSCMLGENNILEDQTKNIKYSLPNNKKFENYIYE